MNGQPVDRPRRGLVLIIVGWILLALGLLMSLPMVVASVQRASTMQGSSASGYVMGGVLALVVLLLPGIIVLAIGYYRRSTT